MLSTAPFADSDDVVAIWRPLASTSEQTQVDDLIGRAWAKLRQAAPFNIEERVALFATNPAAVIALDPMVVADVVATIVKRFLVNTDGAATVSETTGPFSRSATYVARNDRTGSDVRGSIQATAADVEQLRPATPSPAAGTIRTNIPQPRVLLPRGYGNTTAPGQPSVIPDVWPDSGVE